MLIMLVRNKGRIYGVPIIWNLDKKKRIIEILRLHKFCPVNIFR